MQRLDEIIATVTPRKDGRVTVTVKLIGWKPERLTAIEHVFLKTLGAVLQAYRQS